MNKIKITVLWMLFNTRKAKKEGVKGIERRQKLTFSVVSS
tara:strand:+ start:204 stop:323 length:120 start_codon:yes stop_codon:yes gene_type:complete